ncbi:putative Ig domain-containing protein [Elsinoe fawcettii]|nr:putative Ig domain-containing protein [Elsinoe fawcettii]
MRPVILGFIAIASAVPRIAFPFNAQVPPAARISKAYSFQFAAATFGGSPGITYSLVDAPAWLKLDRERQLSGTPAAIDQGTQAFGIRATDETGSATSNCTLVVVSGSGPSTSNKLEDQLSGRLSSSGTLSVYPGDAFTQQFSPQTFSTGSSEIRAYYAVLADRTPLPSWIGFSPSTLSFFGVAPTVGNEAQAYTVTVIATDVVGFSGAEATFTIRVGKRALAFSPQREEYNVKDEININLSGQLFLDSNVLPRDQIVDATLFAPDWLALDKSTLTITGRTPSEFTYQEVSLTVQDVSGNLAQKTLILRRGGVDSPATPREVAQFPNTQLINLTVNAGEDIDYSLPSVYVGQQDFRTTIVFDPRQEWLTYDEKDGKLQGTVPERPSQAVIRAQLTLDTASGRSVTRSFFVNVESGDESPATPASNGPGVIGENPTGTPPDSARLNARQVAGIVVGSIAVVVLLAILLAIWLQRRRKRRSSIDKSYISRPMTDQQDLWTLTPHTETVIAPVPPIQPKPEDKPPQIHLDVPSSPMKTNAFRKSRISTASSLGDGEHAIRADDNIPVWGQSRRHGQHDSYSAATQLSSTTGVKSNNTKRTTFQHLQDRHSRATLTSPLDLKSQQASHHALYFPADTSSSDLLSRTTTTTTTTSSRPPSRPVSVIMRPLSRIAMENRRSVRLVAPSESHLSRASTRPSLLDKRPLAEKRQSFVKNRASSGVPSPLFTTASRDQAPSPYHDALSSPYPRHATKLRYSASSSLEPPLRNPKRLQKGEYPRVLGVGQPRIPGAEEPDGSSQYSTTSEEIATEEEDEALWVREAALPRHQRNWVAPGEASPTPPPETPRETLARRLGRDGSGRMSSPGEGVEVIEPRGAGREVLGLISNDSLSGRGKGKEVVRKRSLLGLSGDEPGDERGVGRVMRRVRERERREGSGKVFI